MDFISEREGEEIQLELKYCERCGGLWLRRQGTDGVHCAMCQVCVAAMPDPGPPPPGKKRRKARLKKMDASEEEPPTLASISYLQGVAALEVCA